MQHNLSSTFSPNLAYCCSRLGWINGETKTIWPELSFRIEVKRFGTMKKQRLNTVLVNNKSIEISRGWSRGCNDRVGWKASVEECKTQMG